MPPAKDRHLYVVLGINCFMQAKISPKENESTTRASIFEQSERCNLNPLRIELLRFKEEDYLYLYTVQ